MFKPDPKPMTVTEFKKLHSKNKKNKFNAIRQTYNGYSYDSKREAQHAYYLDHCSDVVKVEKQYKISLDVNGIHIANYFIDFKVWYDDGRIEYHEVKGAETMLWRLKWRLAQALNPNWKFKIFK